MANDIKIGKYRHFKGQEADVLGVAKHSETKEEFVVYKHPDPQTGEVELWIRPKKMFLETVERDGKAMPRFKYVDEE